MFSVPGWNLSATLTTQVEKPKAKDGPPEGKKSKKRRQKREQRQQVEIDAGNVGEYWERVVGGKDNMHRTNASETSNMAAPNAEVMSEKTGKKRKRKSDGKGPVGAGDGRSQYEGPPESVPEEQLGSVDVPSKREKKKKRKQNHQPASTPDNMAESTTQPPATATVSPLNAEPPTLTPLQKSMRAKLISARFRHLNESLYTKPSKESLDLFKDNPDMFEDYHRGFAQQVEVWPQNPVDGYVDAILSRGNIRTKNVWKDKKRRETNMKGEKASKEDSGAATPSSLKPLPRNSRGHSTIADLGCGTASLSYRLQSSLKPLNLTLHSFDLSKPRGPTADLVTIADISALPLPDASVDVAIFCLALMGTNWLDFIDEAWRILRWRGELWVSEIKSRFGRVGRARGAPPINSIGSLRRTDGRKKKKGKKESAVGQDGPEDSADEAELATQVDGVDSQQEGTDVSAFVAVLRSRGFVLDAPPERPSEAVDLSNKMFVKMQFVKGVAPTKGKNVDVSKERAKDKGDSATAMRMGIKGKKFLAVAAANGDGDGGDEADAKVLKPCLYKIR
ncbi:uncharacterized protein EI97DRAFT_437831 [Westerdykella ornata]|uniref:Ribosomal RNA-processing protein 8 n=1 Tax=Westerdykella ornata TaxID=318751 RepID=A0A6A6J8C2_WESOR|nr:uncharacterized protein EI97DRAFT_437831 [Westerdykella ornata]KAF2271459.1 hypothetical protein EI97DRAFT_437831 [Westerdykella ornata]